jgi:hypothetical protein
MNDNELLIYYGIPVYTLNRLINAGIKTVSELMTMTDDELLQIRGFGTKCLCDVCCVFPERKRNEKGNMKLRRNETILKEWLDGASIGALAETYGLSKQRISQIIKKQRMTLANNRDSS